MFQNLLVYQKSLDFADEMGKLVANLPHSARHIVDQLNRASLSIPLNIAEGNGRWHKGDRKQFFYIARGSCHECVPLLELCFRRKLISETLKETHFETLNEISRMISGLIQGVENRGKVI